LCPTLAFSNIAILRSKCQRASFKSSSALPFFPARAAYFTTFPRWPGRARLVTNPSRTGSALEVKTIGIVCVALTAAGATSPPSANSTSGLMRTRSAAKIGEALRPALRIAVFDHEVVALDVTEIAQGATGCFHLRVGLRGAQQQNAQARDLCRLLRTRRERPCGRAAEQRAAQADAKTVIADLGQSRHPLRVVAFNTAEGWARDVSADIAREVRTRARALDDELPAAARNFVERACA
jgi:hypothetical protein